MQTDDMINNVRGACDPLERIIFDHEDQFVNQLCNCGDVMTLTQVMFSHSCVKIVYVLNSGQHIADTVEYDQLRQWLDGIKHEQ